MNAGIILPKNIFIVSIISWMKMNILVAMLGLDCTDCQDNLHNGTSRIKKWKKKCSSILVNCDI